MNRRAWAIVLSQLVVLALATQALGAPVVIQYWERNWKPEVDATTEIIAKFEAKFPLIKVERTLVDLGEWDTKVRVAVAAGVSIDVMDVTGVVNAANDELIAPLDKYIETDRAWWEDIAPPYRRYLMANGRVYAAPWQDHSRAIIYNTNLTDAAGIVPPQSLADAWTWDEAIIAAKKMTVRDSNNVVKSWGLLTPFRWPHESRAGNFTWFMWQYGADILSNDRTKVTFDSEGAVQALELVRSWFFDHEISPPINTPQPEYPKDYVGGKVGMVIEGNWAFSNFGNPEHLSATALPLGRVKAAPSGGITRGLSANSKNPQAAWEFLKYLTGTESLITLHQFTGHLTPRRSVAQALYRKLMSPPYRVFQEQALEIGRGALQHPMYDRVLGPLNDAVIKVLENKSAAGPALQGAAKQSQTVLDDYYALQKK